MARYDTIGRTGELNHALLVLDIRCMVRLAERRAGLTLRKVAIQVDAVRCQHEWRSAVDLQVLRSEGVPRSRVRPDPGKYFHIVAIHQAQPPRGVQSYQLLYVVGIDSVVVTAWLPRIGG